MTRSRPTLRPRRLLRCLLLALAGFGMSLGAHATTDPMVDNDFVPEHHVVPSELGAYAAGRLGVVEGDYWRVYLVLAYRALSGHPLTPEQVKALNVNDWYVGSMQTMPDAGVNIETWQKAREKIPGARAVEVYSERETGEYVTFVNCKPDAFDRAAATLQDRLKRGGARWAAVWLAGQDAVFANCGQAQGNEQSAPLPLTLPPPLPADAPAWLVDDHQYQTAAALFYAGQYPRARAEFQLIARNVRSPWRPYGAYLAARCLIRRATLLEAAKGEDETKVERAREAWLKQARAELAALSAGFAPAGELLGWVDARVRPDERREEVGPQLAGGRHDARLVQLMTDYLMLMDETTFKGMTASADPMTVWIGAMQATVGGGAEAEKQRRAALEIAGRRWREGGGDAWLLPLLIHARAGELAPDAAEAAAAIPAASPAYVTVRFHLARLALLQGRPDEADALVDGLLARPAAVSTAARNRLLGLKMLTAPTLDAFLQAAPRLPAEKPDPAAKAPAHARADGDFERILYSHLPLATLRAVAEHRALDAFAPAVREKLLGVVWTRAVLLGDYALADLVAERLAGTRPAMRQLYQRFKAARTPEQKRQEAALLFANDEGLTPALPDAQRGLYWDCGDLPGETGANTLRLPPRIVDAGQRAQAAKEIARLRPAASRSAFLAAVLLPWARQKPDDAEVPKALHLFVASTRGECNETAPGEGQPTYSRQAFKLLHALYPKSEWTARTRYHY